MSEKESKFKFWDKLKKIKHIEIYIAILFIVILLLIYLSSTKTKQTEQVSNTSELTISTYVTDMETNLKNILNNVSGVSNVNVMITLDMSQASITNSTISLEEMPAIKGVIITCNGADNTATIMKVLHAVEAVLDITRTNIQILVSE